MIKLWIVVYKTVYKNINISDLKEGKHISMVTYSQDMAVTKFNQTR